MPVSPDLKLNSLSIAPTVMQGLDFDFTYVIQNVGTAASAFSNAGYMFDQMAGPDALRGLRPD